MNRLTETQEDVHAEKEVTQEEIERAWQAVIAEGLDVPPAPGRSEKKAEPSSSSMDRLERGFREYFEGKTVKLRGSWKEFVFDGVVYDESPAGSYAFKLRFRGKTHPGDKALVDDKSLAEQFYVEDNPEHQQ